MSNTRVIDFQRPAPANPGPQRATLVAIADGRLRVRDHADREFDCDWLDRGHVTQLAPGDTVLALPPDASGRGIVLGRVGPFREPQAPPRLTLEATEILTLKCGDVSIDLRAADGKLMLRGEDVLLRARRTQRIRAGNVAIN